jgi:hypothetical protein
MAGKSIDLVLRYRVDGQDRFLSVTVDFISNYVSHKFNEIIQGATAIKVKWDMISDLTTLIAGLQAERPDGYKEKVKENQAKITELAEEITSYDADTFVEKRSEIFGIILKDNGINEEKFFDHDFIDRCIDPNDMMEFMTQSVYKDMDKKKLM